MRFPQAKLLALALALAAGCFAPYAVQADDSPADSPVHWTPMLVSPVQIPQCFRGSDGKWNLVYELELTNFGQHKAVLEGLQVMDADNQQRVVLNLNGDALIDILDRRQEQDATKRTINPGATAVIWVNIEMLEQQDVPKNLVHRIIYHVYSQANTLEAQTYLGAPLAVNLNPPVVISQPLHGGKWVAEGGYASKYGHRRALFPIDNKLVDAQRYAIDWIQLDENNYSHKNISKILTSWTAYGQPVLAVADGTVVGVVSKFSDQIPYTPSRDRFFPGGNSVTIDIGNGLYAFYAHLKPNSITVHEGDRVSQGQVIGQLGNSGNSTQPHLHLHITNGPFTLGSDGVPYVFNSFAINGRIGDTQKFYERDEQAKPQFLEPVSRPGKHSDELPKDGDVVTFD